MLELIYQYILKNKKCPDCNSYDTQKSIDFQDLQNDFIKEKHDCHKCKHSFLIVDENFMKIDKK